MAREMHMYSLSEAETHKEPYVLWPRCGWCGVVIAPPLTGRPPRYGSDACQQKAYRDRALGKRFAKRQAEGVS